MRKAYVSKALRQKVFQRAQNRCEYCQTQATFTAVPMEVDHIIPQSLEGTTDAENLCLACSHCNDAKNDRIKALDPLTEQVVNLYNPRKDNWSEHFVWSEDGQLIIGLTPSGRATVIVLNMNRPEYILARQFWVKAGWHPPED
jgi:HNH endonuclease